MLGGRMTSKKPQNYDVDLNKQAAVVLFMFTLAVLKFYLDKKIYIWYVF